MPLSRADPTHDERFKLALTAHAVLHLKDIKKELDAPRLRIYWKVLEPFDIEVIEQASDALLGEMSTFPKPRHLKDACLKILQRRERGRRVSGAQADPAHIVCEECRDVGWRYVRADTGAPVDLVRMRELEDEYFRRPEDERPTYRWRVRACFCRAKNPNFQQHMEDQQAGRDAPFTSNEAEYLAKKYLPSGHWGVRSMTQRRLLEEGED